jgi:hypothetical protein
MSGEGFGAGPGLAANRRSLLAHPILAAVVLLAVVGLIQYWLRTCGLWVWPRYTLYYPILTDAFMHGQTSLRLKPPAALLALADPYDPAANQGLRFHDAVLYGGKYYLYWGPAPALLAAGVCLALNIYSPDYSDEQLDFLFVFGSVVLATVLLSQVRARLFPKLSAWTILPPVLSLGLGAVALRCGGVYGAAIAGGQFFLLAGVCAGWFGFSSRRARPIWFLAAGSCWALAGGSRVSLPPALAAVAGITLWQAWRGRDQPPGGRSFAAAAAALIVPLLAGAGLMAGYNFARFGSVTEMGLHYQLAGRNQHAMLASEFASWRFVLPNVIRYLLEPPRLSGEFPFVWARHDQSITRIDTLLWLPKGFGFDWVAGLYWTQPFVALAIPALMALGSRRAFHAGGEPADQRRGIWLTACLFAGGVVGFLPSLIVNGSAIRYLMDIIPSFTILAGMGYFWVLSACGDRRRWIEAIAVLVVLGQSAVGILLAINGPNEAFAKNNPELYGEMSSMFGGR